jgi:cysteinyl-tRNA synthetase
MSKSLGNSLVVTEVAKRVRPIELRWYLASAHYRSNLEFSDSSLQESAVAFQRIENFVIRANSIVGEVDLKSTPMCADFEIAMNEDLNVPAALAALHEVVGEGNTLLANKAKATEIKGALASVRKMLDILGVDPLAETWNQSGKKTENLETALDYFVQQAIAVRTAAKENKSFEAADAIRDSLRDVGIALEDTPDGVRWNLEK